MSDLVLYVGQKKVERIDGNTVYFENGDSVTYTEAALQYVLTPEPISESDLLNTISNEVLKDMFLVFRKHDIRLTDIGAMLQKAQWSVEVFRDKALCKAAGMQDKFDGNVDIQVRNIRISHLESFLGQDVDSNS